MTPPVAVEPSQASPQEELEAVSRLASMKTMDSPAACRACASRS